MGYLEDLKEVIEIHEFEIDLYKDFSRKKQTEYFSEGFGKNKQYYSKEFLRKTEEYTVLQLWTIFERNFFELTKQYIFANNDEGTLKYAIEEKTAEKLERWPLDEILDLYKTIIDSNTVGMIKQIKRYRDWLVHKNPKKGTPGKITHKDAYIYLSNFLRFITTDLLR